MKVCIVAEGCYPYVVGGVSGWINSLIRSFPNVEFILLAIVANRSFRGKFVYELPENLLEIYKELQKEDENGKLPDIVLGSRFMEGSSGFSVSFAKKIAFVWFRIMLKTGTGRRITDPTTGLQGLNWRTFLFYSKYNNFDDKYPDANMLMQMLLLGFRVREIPAVMHVRTTGVSMHSGLKPVLYMFRMTFSILAVWIREKILKMDEDKIHELEKYDE